MKYTFESISGTLKIFNNYLIFFALLFLCLYIWRIQNNNPTIQEKKRLDEYYYTELYETYKFNLNPVYGKLEDGFSDYIGEIEESMRMDNYNSRQIKELESKAYASVLRMMEKKEKNLTMHNDSNL